MHDSSWHARVRYNLALAMLKLKQWEEGAAALNKTVQIEPGNREYFVTLANLYLNFGKREQARSLAESILKQVPDHQDASELLKALNNRKE